MELSLSDADVGYLKSLNLSKAYATMTEIQNNKKSFNDKDLMDMFRLEVKDPRFWNYLNMGKDVLEVYTVFSAQPIYLSKSFWNYTTYTNNDLMEKNIFEMYEREASIEAILADEMKRVAYSGKVITELAVNDFDIKEKKGDKRKIRLHYKACTGVSLAGQVVGVACIMQPTVIHEGKSQEWYRNNN